MRRAAFILAALTLSACATTPFAGNAVFADPEAHAGETVRFCGRIGEDDLLRAEDGSGAALTISDWGPVNPAFTGGICIEGVVGEDAANVAIVRVLDEGD
jgi:outer membrane lipoprotein SlyB